MPPKPAPLPPPLRGPKDPPLRPRPLAVTVALFDALVKRREAHLFPEGLAPAAVRATLAAAIEAGAEAQRTGAAQKTAVARLRKAEAASRRALTRLLSLVDANFPHGAPNRAAFFPAGQGQATYGERLLAMVKGVRAHGLRGAPADLALAAIEALAREVGADQGERAATGGGKLGTAARRAELRAETHAIRKRLVAMLQGHYGRQSSELAAYGLRPHSIAGRRTRKKKPPAVPPKPPGG